MSWLRELCWLLGGCMLSCFSWKRRNSFSFSRMVIWPCSTCSALWACSLLFTRSPSCPLRVCSSLMYSMAFSNTKPLFRLACAEEREGGGKVGQCVQYSNSGMNFQHLPWTLTFFSTYVLPTASSVYLQPLTPTHSTFYATCCCHAVA